MWNIRNIPSPPNDGNVPRECVAIGWIQVFLIAFFSGCALSAPDSQTEPQTTTVVQPASESEVKAFCGGCHQVPEPRSFAAADWREEVAFGYRLHQDSTRTDLRPPPKERVIAYYERLAPRALTFDDLAQVSIGHRLSPLQFTAHDILADVTKPPAVARLEMFGEDYLIADMHGGIVWRWRLGTVEAVRQWEAPHPASLVQVALRPNDQPGIIVGDLGSFLPEDRYRGALWWAASAEGSELQPLISKLARVSHVAAGDLDADGRPELVISEFGWRRTGQLSIAWNEEKHAEWPPLTMRVLDPRHGCLKTVLTDFDNDGQIDVLAAFAQEHETVDRFRFLGDRQFEHDTLYRAPDPAWGTSDFEVVDLDQDGRQDLIVCHGDSFDGGDLRPYHGIRWLRQVEAGQIETSVLALMPGVHRVIPADLDADGDLDLAAVALLPKSILSSSTRPRLASVVWLEQISAGQFVPHVLEWDQCQHATCVVTDEDHDGDLDLVVGHFHWEGNDRRLLTVFRNGLKSP